MIEKEVYLHWKTDPCTQEFLKNVGQTIEELISRLCTEYNLTEKESAYLRGWIKALVEIAEWKPELVEVEDEEY